MTNTVKASLNDVKELQQDRNDLLRRCEETFGGLITISNNIQEMIADNTVDADDTRVSQISSSVMVCIDNLGELQKRFVGKHRR